MRAAGYDHYGGADLVSFRDVAPTRARAGEVVVRAEAAALDPKDIVAAIPVDHISVVDAKVDVVAAAATPLAGSTALQALRDDAELTAHQRE
jgi:NADPH:quinone reductase-like Zn-dependent oxidoreductase